MTEQMMAVEFIQIVGRHRKDLGDIEGLAASIKAEGLINPITVTPDGRLLAGERRLAAVRLLGKSRIEAHVVDTLGDAATAFRIERDENTQRKAMTPSELVALGQALEELERPRTAARKSASAHVAGRARHGLPASVPVGPLAESGRTQEIVAAALGISRNTYARAKSVVEAAEDETLPEEVREAAMEALTDMDSGAASITAAHERVTSEKKVRLGRSVSPPLAGARLQRAGMKRSLPGLTGMAMGFDLMTEVDPAVTDEEIRQWVADLSKARLSIERLIKRLKERISEEP